MLPHPAEQAIPFVELLDPVISSVNPSERKTGYPER
jgi:hypothetical protein